MSELKREIEALLFSSGKKMHIDEIKTIVKARKDKVRHSLLELKEEYDNKKTAITVVEEDEIWSMNIKEKYVGVAQKIVTETELSKAVMETLAVIAFKYPIKQSDLINIRSNKAYDHLKELEELGYIIRKRYGRTNLIKLSEKFFDYFDLPPGKLKETFKDFESIANAIQNKEEEAKQAKEKIKKQKDEEKAKQEEDKENIEVYDVEEHNNQDNDIKVYENKEKYGELEVFDEEDENTVEVKENTDVTQENDEEDIDNKEDEIYKEEEVAEVPDEEFKDGKLIEVDDEMEKKIDKRVEEIINPELEDEEDENSSKKKEDSKKNKDSEDDTEE